MNILLVEDNKTDAYLTIRSLIRSIPGCTIEIAQTLTQARNLLEKAPYDIVLLDMTLPDGNGLDLLIEIRKSELNMAVIILTGLGNEEIAVAALKAGADDYISKHQGYISKLPGVIDFAIQNFKQNIQQKSDIIDVLYLEHYDSDINLTERHMKQYAPYIRLKTVTTIQRALSSLVNCSETCKFRVILMDDRPFGLNALDVIKIIRQEKKLDIPIILIANHGSEEIAVQALKLGANEYLTKNKDYMYRLPSLIVSAYHYYELKRNQAVLVKAKERAEESDKLKSAFMANMSHEIRTPMNGILGFAELLKNPNLPEEKQKKYVEVIELSGRRMLNIINDLIDISRIETGQIEVKKETTNIPELLEQLLIFFTPESEKRGISLKLNMQLPSVEFLVETDKTKIAQVITNLLKNALKFTNCSGYIELGCKLQDNSTLFFYVKDTGMGIRKDLQDKIFERFKQGEVNNLGIHEGIGLGLTISKAFVEMLGGKIGLESEPDKGSIFFFTIPFEGNMLLPQTYLEEHDKIKISLSCLTILVADDDDTSYILLKEILQKNNISTYHARNGLEAVNLLKTHFNINLILMDIKMPVMNGLEAAREIKKIKSEVPIIAQSAFVTESEIQRAFDAGCTDYITKPIEKKKLLDKIATHCKS